MANQETMAFEEALAGLEAAAEALKKEGTTLNDSMDRFQEGMKYYQQCKQQLNDAKQTIKIYEKENEILQEF